MDVGKGGMLSQTETYHFQILGGYIKPPFLPFVFPSTSFSSPIISANSQVGRGNLLFATKRRQDCCAK